MDPKEDSHHHHRHISKLLMIVIILVIVIILLVKPALTGYKISSQFSEIELSSAEILKTQELTRSKLLITETNLTICNDVKQSLLEELNKEKGSISSCTQEKEVQESKCSQLKNECDANISRIKSAYEQDSITFVKSYELNMSLMKSQLEQEKSNAEKATSDYNELVLFAGRNICCKAKIDDATIDSYEIAGNKIVCTTGGKNKITC